MVDQMTEGYDLVGGGMAQVFVGEAVRRVGPAASDHVHLSARVAAILGAVCVGRDLEFLNGVQRWLQVVAIDVWIVVVDTVELEVVELLSSAIGVHRERSAG